LFTFDVDHLGTGGRGENEMEEFLAMLAVQLLMLFAERVVSFLTQSARPVAA